MAALPLEIRYLLQGGVVTLAVLGAIATITGAFGVLVLLLLASRGHLFSTILDSGFTIWLFLAALLQIPIWIALPRVRFVSRRFGHTLTALMILATVTIMVGGLGLRGLSG
jgi:hypothetical protein